MNGKMLVAGAVAMLLTVFGGVASATDCGFDRITSLERFGLRTQEAFTERSFAYVRDAGFNGVFVNGGAGFAPDQMPVESLVRTEAIPDLMSFTAERNRAQFRRNLELARKAGVRPWICWWTGLGAQVGGGSANTLTFARRMGLELGAAYRRHPEFFGQGGGWRGNHPLCVSHPTVRAFYRELVARLAEEYPEIEGLFFFPGDATLENCSDACATCAKTGLSRFERMMSFVNEMHAAWTKDRPRRFYYALWNIGQPCCRKYDEREITDVLVRLDPRIGIALTISDIVRQERTSGSVALNQPWGICPEKGDQWRLLEERAGERPLMAVSEISQSEQFDPVCGNMPFACATLALLRNVASVRRADALVDFWGNRPPYAPDACHAVLRAWVEDPKADDVTLLRRAAVRHYGEANAEKGVVAWRSFDRLMRTFPLCGWSQRFSFAIGREGARGPLYLPLVPQFLGSRSGWELSFLLQAGQTPAAFERAQREAMPDWEACATAFDGVSRAEADAIRLAGRLNVSIGSYVLARELYRERKTDELRALIRAEMGNREEQLRLSAGIAPNSGVNAILVEEDLQNMSLYLADRDFPDVPADRFSLSDVDLTH